MPASPVVDGLWQIALGASNAFLIDDDGTLTLIDTGVPNSEGKIVRAIESLNRQPFDVRHIIVTHCHPDHAGSLAAMKRLTGAPAYMHPIDAAMVRKGEGKRPLRAAPGVLKRILFQIFVAHNDGRFERSEVDHEIIDGTELPIAGGLKAIHVPGQCAGQLALLWGARRLLFAADAASTMGGLGLSLGYESLADGLQSLHKLSALDFEVACFGHGQPIMANAAAAFRKKWGNP